MSDYHCDKCNKLKPVDVSKINIGDKVRFTKVAAGARKTRMTSITGTLFLKLDNGQFSVNYRKTLYRVNDIQSIGAPSGISYALIGMCDCEANHE